MKKSYLILGTIGIIIILGIIYVSFFGDFNKNKIINNSSSVQCLKAGEIYQSPAGLGEKLGECCKDLTVIEERGRDINGQIDCELATGGSNAICSACGNNNCERDLENKCNCPQDCSD